MSSRARRPGHQPCTVRARASLHPPGCVMRSALRRINATCMRSSSPRPGRAAPAPSWPRLSALLPNCTTPPEYRLIAKKGEGTFSEVLKAQCIKNGKYVAIKCMKNHFDSIDQVGSAGGRAASSAGVGGAGLPLLLPQRSSAAGHQRADAWVVGAGAAACSWPATRWACARHRGRGSCAGSAQRCQHADPGARHPPAPTPTQVNNLREIQALRRLSPHPNIIKLLEVLYDQPTGGCRAAGTLAQHAPSIIPAAPQGSHAARRLPPAACCWPGACRRPPLRAPGLRPAGPAPAGRLALIFELMDMNIYELIRGRKHYVAEERVQHFMCARRPHRQRRLPCCTGLLHWSSRSVAARATGPAPLRLTMGRRCRAGEAAQSR